MSPKPKLFSENVTENNCHIPLISWWNLSK